MADRLSSALAVGTRRSREMTAGRLRLLLLLLVAAAVWAWCAHALWSSTVPALKLPHVDPNRFFSAAFLQRSASFDRFLSIDLLLELVALIAVLVVFARRGQELARESAAGRIGTGILLGMLGYS